MEDSGWEPNGVTHPVRFYEGGGTYPLRGFPPLLSKSACCVRCGGSWKRDYGLPYPGTKGETPDTDKGRPNGLPRQLSTLPGILSALIPVQFAYLRRDVFIESPLRRERNSSHREKYKLRDIGDNLPTPLFILSTNSWRLSFMIGPLYIAKHISLRNLDAHNVKLTYPKSF